MSGKNSHVVNLGMRATIEIFQDTNVCKNQSENLLLSFTFSLPLQDESKENLAKNLNTKQNVTVMNKR